MMTVYLCNKIEQDGTMDLNPFHLQIPECSIDQLPMVLLMSTGTVWMIVDEVEEKPIYCPASFAHVEVSVMRPN